MSGRSVDSWSTTRVIASQRVSRTDGPESVFRNAASTRCDSQSVWLRILIFAVQHSTWASTSIRCTIGMGFTMSAGAVQRRRFLCAKEQTSARPLRAHHENHANNLRSPRRPMGKSLPSRRAYGDTNAYNLCASTIMREPIIATLHGGRCSRDRGVVHVTSARMQPVPGLSGSCCPFSRRETVPFTKERDLRH